MTTGDDETGVPAGGDETDNPERCRPALRGIDIDIDILLSEEAWR